MDTITLTIHLHLECTAFSDYCVRPTLSSSAISVHPVARSLWSIDIWLAKL